MFNLLSYYFNLNKIFILHVVSYLKKNFFLISYFQRNNLSFVKKNFLSLKVKETLLPK